MQARAHRCGMKDVWRAEEGGRITSGGWALILPLHSEYIPGASLIQSLVGQFSYLQYEIQLF